MIASYQPSTNLSVKKHPIEIIDDLLASDHAWEGMRSSFGDTINLSAGDAKDVVNYYSRLLAIAKHRGNKRAEGAAYGILGFVFLTQLDYEKTIEYFSHTLDIAKELGDKKMEAYYCQSLGDIFLKVGNFNKVIEYQNVALSLSVDLGEKLVEGTACNGLGNAFRGLCRYKEAIDYYNRCLSVAKGLDDKALEATAYGNLGHAFECLGDYKQAQIFNNQCLSINKSLGHTSGEGMMYTNLGNVYSGSGDYRKALEYYNRSLNIARNTGNKRKMALVYGGLANASLDLGDTKNGIQYANLQLTCAKEMGNKDMEGSAYGTLGHIYKRLGDYKKSIEYSNLHLDIAKAVGNLEAEGGAYGGLGCVFDSLGDFEKAIDYHKQHLHLARTIGDKDGEAIAYGNLGNAYLGLEDFTAALHFFQQRLRIAKDVGDKAGEGRAYGHLGGTFQRLGNYKKAIDYYNLRLCIAQEVGDKAGEGAACGYLGTVSQFLGDYNKAIDWHNQQLTIAKNIGDQGMEGLARSYIGQCFEMLKVLPKALENYQTSVEVFNQMRSLLQSKDKWKIGFRNECNYAYTGLCRVLLKQEKIEEALAAAEEGRAQSLADLMTFQYGFHEGQTEGKRLDEEEFGMLNNTSSSTIFLSLSENKINIWLLLKEKPVLHRQKTLCHHFAENAAAETLQSLIQFAYKNNDVRANVNCENRSLDVLRENCFTVKRSSKKFSHQILQEDNPPLAALYSYVIAPILDLIEGDELIIVPDGPLWLAPFAALLNPFSKYLYESFKVRIIPSLTSLRIIAHCPKFHSSSGALVVGDPDMSEVTNSQGDQILEQLPFARQEAQMIGQILNTAPLTGNLATKREVLKQISSVAVVHIAAHGRMETGEIALSPNPERESQTPAEEDYMLTMADVMSVKLRAKLVVLSCCHSGRGEIKAEGVVGIARAFIGAGARSVLVSLWAIDDEATLEFMKSFYHNLVKGRSASDSLNRAMKCLRESEKFGDLKYWAPFTLIGDDVTLDKQEEIRVS